MTFRELCTKEVVQLKDGAGLGRVDDLELDEASARIESLLLLGRPRLFGLLGRDHPMGGHRAHRAGRHPCADRHPGGTTLPRRTAGQITSMAERMKVFQLLFVCRDWILEEGGL